jgi:hypothetical protein
MLQEFHLSPPGLGRGVSCDAHGAFIGDVPLLKRSIVGGKERWEPRERAELSKAIGAHYGLPIDVSSKMGGVKAIANALNEGDVARAQIATVLLGIPDAPVLPEGAGDHAELIKCIHDLQRSGLLKADWDSDEHPRWPAGAPDSQGGQFAPKGDDTGQTIGDAATPRSRNEAQPEVTISPRQRFYGADVPSSIQPALQVNAGSLESLLAGNGQSSASDADDLGIYAPYGSHVGDVQLASTAATTLDELIGAAKPANWADPVRLANGALRLGTGEIITAAALLTTWDIQREKDAVDAAFSKFGFDPTNAADVLAIRAYVWAKNFAPVNFDVPWSEPELESASQSIMALELARPGTVYLSTLGDKVSTNLMRVAVQVGTENGAIFESRARPTNMPAALQTTSEAARAVLGLKTNDRMQAHHLIPANVWADSPITKLAGEGGWDPNSATNLIELPADTATQGELLMDGQRLPVHNSSHPDYDAIAAGKIIEAKAIYGMGTLTPAQA